MKNPNWTPEEDAILTKKYGVLSYKDMLEHLPEYRTVSSIKNRVRQLSIELVPQGTSSFSHERVDVDDAYFDQLNEVNTYWAGFISADGCIKDGDILKVKVSCRDTPHLLRLKEAIGYQGQHTYQTRVNKTGSVTRSIEFSARSAQICNQLQNNFGIGPRKTKILDFPSLSNNLLDAWIVGYIDGDGTVGYYGSKGKQKYLNIVVVGTEDVCKGIRGRFSEVIGESIENKISEKDGLYRFQISGQRAVSVYQHYKQIRVPNLDRKWSYVPKNWGYELWIANSEKYCGKVLYLNKGKRFSYHFHKVKDETFYLHSGRMLVKYGETDDLTQAHQMEFEAGSILHIPVGLNHQVIAMENSFMYEFSTQHFDEDSFRLEKGD